MPILSGTVTIGEYPDTLRHETRRVNFSPHLGDTPRVAAALAGIDAQGGLSTRVGVWADDVSSSGFTLNLLSWDDSVTYSATVVWVASCGQPGFEHDEREIGSYPDHPVKEEWVDVRFDSPFSSPPRVGAALTMIDADGNHNLRVRTNVEEVRADGFRYSVHSWGDSQTWSVKVTHFAVDAAAPPPGVAIGDHLFGGHPSQVRDEEFEVESGRQLLESEVALMLSGLDVQAGHNTRLETRATRPKDGNFTLHATTWDDSITWGAQLTWLATPRGGSEVVPHAVPAPTDGPLPGYTCMRCGAQTRELRIEASFSFH